MPNTALFLFNSTVLGAGLAVDALSVSIADGIADPRMNNSRRLSIPLVFGLFQGIMPLIGYFLVHSAVQCFEVLGRIVPWIAMFILLYLGLRMMLSPKGPESLTPMDLSARTLLVQGVATSLDALSVGFLISDYTVQAAVVCSAIIAVVTFLICFAGVAVGKKAGIRLASRASVVGGLFLVLIGAEILITGLF